VSFRGVLTAFACLGALLAPSGCGRSAGPPVVVLGVWTDAEQAQFEQVLRDFTQATGIPHVYQGSRALDQVLRADVRDGNAPDVAVVASPTQLAGYASGDQLSPLDGVLPPPAPGYSDRWERLSETADKNGVSHRYALVVKADLKSVIWYDPNTVRTLVPGSADGHLAPASWSALTTMVNALVARGGPSAAPWCLGMGAGSTSGFPGTDWIEDIVLHEFGPSLYQQWADGALPWTAPQVRQAFLDWGSVLAHARGGTMATLLTDFADAGKPMFGSPPGCVFDHEGSFVMGAYGSVPAKPALRAGKDYDFFPFPPMKPGVSQSYEASASFAAMFQHNDRADRLMNYLASVRGQQEMVTAFGGNSFSVDPRVAMSVYPDDVHRRVARILTQDSSCFDASDLMPTQLGTAFYQAVLRFASDPGRYLADQNALTDLLSQLERERVRAYGGRPLSFTC
jgi:alpha-glucoside transport system substrate-binding protein